VKATTLIEKGAKELVFYYGQLDPQMILDRFWLSIAIHAHFRLFSKRL
jgi:hypothetical protein